MIQIQTKLQISAKGSLKKGFLIKNRVSKLNWKFDLRLWMQYQLWVSLSLPKSRLEVTNAFISLKFYLSSNHCMSQGTTIFLLSIFYSWLWLEIGKFPPIQKMFKKNYFNSHLENFFNFQSGCKFEYQE